MNARISHLALFLALSACGASATSAPEARTACAAPTSGRVLSLELSLQPLAENASSATPEVFVTQAGSEDHALGAQPYVVGTALGAEMKLNVVRRGTPAHVELTVPARFDLADEGPRDALRCDPDCGRGVHWARHGSHDGELDVDVALPPELGGAEHLLHVHAPTELTTAQCP